MPYRWTGAHPHTDHRTGDVIDPGDVFDAERIAAAHPDNCETVSDGNETDVEICGAELSTEGTCDRPIDECPYHDAEDR